MEQGARPDFSACSQNRPLRCAIRRGSAAWGCITHRPHFPPPGSEYANGSNHGRTRASPKWVIFCSLALPAGCRRHDGLTRPPGGGDEGWGPALRARDLERARERIINTFRLLEDAL